MAKSTKTTMVRRGRKYLIERSADGTFGRFVPQGEAKKSSKNSKTAAKAVKRTTKKTGKKQLSGQKFNRYFSFSRTSEIEILMRVMNIVYGAKSQIKI